MTSFNSPHVRRKSDSTDLIEFKRAISIITEKILSSTDEELKHILSIQNDLLKLTLTRMHEKGRGKIMETLREKQSRFAVMVAKLISQASALGYEVTLGDAYRDPRLHGAIGEKKGYGHSKSAHKNSLAIDLNLFKDGEFLGDTESHKPLGEWWEAQAPECRWGGRFKDGNHYSFEHDGIK